jgi:peptidoglycan hydrolase FlgJ
MAIDAIHGFGGGLGARASGLGGAASGAMALTLVPNPEPRTPALSGQDTPALKEAFTDFVGQSFFGELLKQMRATVGKPAYMHGGFGEDVFQSQLDQVLVERISDASAATFSDPMYQLMLVRRA